MSLDREVILEGEIKAIAGFSGTKKRCPECSREVHKGFCAVHADVEPEKQFSMTVKVDNEKVEIDEENFEKLAGIKPSEVEALPANEKINFLKKKLEGVKVRVTGNNGGEKFYSNNVDVLNE